MKDHMSSFNSRSFHTGYYGRHYNKGVQSDTIRNRHTATQTGWSRLFVYLIFKKEKSASA